nr:immunoglobulin heavy chain junction region [Macaca mulatta]
CANGVAATGTGEFFEFW